MSYMSNMGHVSHGSHPNLSTVRVRARDRYLSYISAMFWLPLGYMCRYVRGLQIPGAASTLRVDDEDEAMRRGVTPVYEVLR